MSTTNNNAGPHSLADGIRALRAKWGWIVGFGVFAVIAGFIALGSARDGDRLCGLIVGLMMLMAGVVEIVAAFNAKDWSHRLLWLLLGALYVFAGFVCIQNPFEAATLLTLMLGIALIVVGLAAHLPRDPDEAGHAVGLGRVLGHHQLPARPDDRCEWPVSSAYVLGIFLGIDLIFMGTGWISIGLALKRHARS